MSWARAEVMINHDAGTAMKLPSDFERARDALIVAVLIVVGIFLVFVILLAQTRAAPAGPIFPAIEETWR
ncbi:hypothetical protein [Xanthobacter flavus]|uniref:hypothetical protein n=1 Tax=Xanthobacter flavus TaxID=281 RepID=UPI001AE5F73B|nr:hypothetical protein [Xanthobacter flavus]MBP2147444.1 hypothetical protein [Xanthobacter flavus]